MQVRVAVSLADACWRLVGRGPGRGGAVVALCLCATIMPFGAQGQVAQWRDVIGAELINALGNAGNLADGGPFVTELRVRDASDLGLAGVIRAAVPAPRCVGAASVIEPFDRGDSNLTGQVVISTPPPLTEVGVLTPSWRDQRPGPSVRPWSRPSPLPVMASNSSQH